jgi:hypothetical protein
MQPSAQEDFIENWYVYDRYHSWLQWFITVAIEQKAKEISA